MKKNVCIICSWIYNPEAGDAKSRVEPETACKYISKDWAYPLCGCQ